MKKFTLFIFLVALSNLVMSQNQEIAKVAKTKETVTAIKLDTAKAWFIDGLASLNFSQAAFSNWASGGQNSLGLTSFFNLKANYRKGRNSWGNTIDLGSDLTSSERCQMHSIQDER